MQLSDWIIIILYLVAMLGIGFFAKGKIQTMDDFILGGKRFGKVALIGTIVATMVGSGMTMGAVGTAYKQWINKYSPLDVLWIFRRPDCHGADCPAGSRNECAQHC